MSTKPNLVRNSCVVPKAKVKRKRKTVHMEMLLDKPRISSLDEFTPNLPDDIRHHLSNQYGHLQSVLDAMKLPPKVTTCRVNLITSTKLQVIDEIKDRLSVWNQTTGNRIGENQCASPIFSVKSNKCFDDVIDIYHNVSATPIKNDPPLDLCRKYELFKHWPNRNETKWPLSHRVIICDRRCGEAVLSGSNIFVKGILVADSGIKKGEELVVSGKIEVCKDGKKDIPLTKGKNTATRGLMLDKYTGYCVFLGIGVACCDRSDMFSLCQGLGVEMIVCQKENKGISTRAGPVLPPLNGVLVGKMMLQHFPSTLVAHALDPQQGESILDMCAAPGGKSSHVASLVANNATIVSCDRSRKKVLSMRNFFDELKATCIVPLVLDSTKCIQNDNSIKNDQKQVCELISSSPASDKDGLLTVHAFSPESFDRIILDPPCSALGLRPKLHIDAKNVHDINKHATYQKKFVTNAVALLKKGGTMTYSTCTINSLENEGMVRYILDEFPVMRLVPIDYDVGLPGLHSTSLTDEERGMVRRFDPSDVADTIGFFVAKFQKDC